MDASPSMFYNRNPRKLLFQMQSQSQPRLNFTKIINRSLDTKHPLTHGSSFLSRTNTLSPEKTPSNNQSHLDKISDFYNKTQIKDAISSANKLKDRIKLVDSIIKRRVEIKEMEDQTRFERVAPIIQKASETLKSRVLARTQENRVRKSILVDCLKSANSNVTSPTFSQPETPSKQSPRNAGGEERRYSRGLETPKDIALIHSVLSKMAEARKYSVKLPLQETLPIENKTTDETPMKRDSLNSPANAQTPMDNLRRASNILSFLARSPKKANSPQESPRGLVFDNIIEMKNVNKPESISKPLLRSTTRSFGTRIETGPVKVGGLSRDTYGLGAKVLEQDIYMYLAKNNKMEEISKFMTGTEEIKEPLMRDIEMKAKAKWSKFQDKRKQVSYMLPNSMMVKSNSNEKAMLMQRPGSGEADRQARSPASKKVMMLKKGVKSSSAVRLIKNETLNSPQISL